MKNCYIIIVIVIISVSCNPIKKGLQADLDTALYLSKENRPELERVLEYYSKDPKNKQKLKAAEFLISNMIRHYSIGGSDVERYVREVDSVCFDKPQVIKSFMYGLYDRIDSYASNVEIKYDLHNIKSDFLIQSIEDSFKVWENTYYKSNITFEEFCEYILPYRISKEPLAQWKKDDIKSFSGMERYDDYLFDMDTYDNFCFASISSYEVLAKIKLKDSMLKKYVPDCIDRANYEVMVNAALGVPATIDFVPHYPTKENRHYWSVVVNNRSLKDKQSRFVNPYAAKVFRKTYSMNPYPNDSENFVPSFMRDPYNKDVTELYEKVVDVDYKFNNIKSGTVYAYLAVFNNLSWNEVAWAEVKRGGGVKFKKMGRGVIYMPTYYDKNTRMFGDYPVLVDVDGKSKEIKPNKDITQNITLKRKFPVNVMGEYSSKNMLGMTLEGTNELKNESYDSLAVITRLKNMEYDTLTVNSSKEYKYWLLHNTNRKYADIADVMFFDKDGNRIDGEPFFIDSNDNIKFVKTKEITNMFDNNPLTYSNLGGKYLGVDFKKPVNISKFVYITKNDANGVYPDNEYELFYFDKGKWVSLGKKIADKHSLDYDNVPTNALFWLRNHTEGKEERPFTVENGKIRFW